MTAGSKDRRPKTRHALYRSASGRINVRKTRSGEAAEQPKREKTGILTMFSRVRHPLTVILGPRLLYAATALKMPSLAFDGCIEARDGTKLARWHRRRRTRIPALI